MNKQTYEALQSVIENTRTLLALKYKNRKRLNQEEVWEKATLIRDIVAVENWMDEVEGEILND